VAEGWEGQGLRESDSLYFIIKILFMKFVISFNILNDVVLDTSLNL
jgi:hypothetical protein